MDTEKCDKEDKGGNPAEIKKKILGDPRDFMYRYFFSRNLIKSIRNQIVFTIFRLICYQTDVRLIPNLSMYGKYNLIWV